MPRSRASGSEPRAARAKLGGSILALILLQNGRQVRAKLHQLSVTGGLLHVTQPLDEAIVVEMAFHVKSNTVRTKAEMLFPMWATQGWLQPFRFVDLAEEDRDKLEKALQSLVEKTAATAATNSGSN